MRLFTIILVALLLAIWIPAYSQAEATTARPTIGPTIMVIPFAKEEEQLRSILENDAALRVAVTKVKEGFDDRGYSTIDFRAKLNQLNNDRVMEMENATSLKQEVIELSGADIYVEIEVQKTRSGSGNSVTVVMTAYDAYSSQSLANKVASSPKFYTDDYGKLTERALGNTVEELLNTIQLKFDDIVENGRTISMSITFGMEAEKDMDTEVGTDGDLLSDGVTATKLLVDAIKVPLKDENGRNFRASRFAGQFRNYLKALGLEATRDVQGNRIFITIQ
jgi:hypothetical protein